ncbi:hypothetical protein DDZ18_11065 [Marinicauda salina]|uniref:Putative DNA-binding domain-containing protein n=1 Tax=Marinicauda salina TaxID=2135793 RepID=A0A2U2BRU5_9PROT|nr:DNA-binding domain-containing protein [Marinicauda salina]PWE16737.1 hypothetical protein DDZ18_11065 [Marinicauda salina]
MTEIRDFADAFRAALGGDEAGLAAHLDEPDVAARIAVYRNNRATALSDVLAGAFPGVAAVVGTEYMTALARAYADARPPASPVLSEWGAEFPDFLAGFPPARSLPYLADIARLDRAWSAVHYAADPDPETAAALARLDEAALLATPFRLEASARRVALDWPVHDFWRELRDDRPVTKRKLAPAPAAALVWRGGNGVTSAALDDATAPLVAGFAETRPLGAALKACADPDAALQFFSTLLADRAIAPAETSPGDAP